MVCVVAWACLSCSSTATQIVVAIATDLNVPQELDRVTLSVTQGTQKFDDAYTLTDAAVSLPATKSIVAGADLESGVHIVVTGFKSNEMVVQRAARLRFVKGRALLLRIVLSRNCVPLQECPSDKTCIDGTCQAIDIDGKTLPDYSEAAALQPIDAGNESDTNANLDGAVDLDTAIDYGGVCDDGDPPRTCYTGPSSTLGIGECKSGIQECVGNQWVVCEGQTLPQQELCNDIDDNCSGSIDEGLEQSCYSGPAGTAGKGLCRAGIRACKITSPCIGEIKPVSEVCNDGQDNDCDDQTDEGCACTGSEAQPCGSDEGECSKGTQTCASGSWGNCAGAQGPVAESCNGKDDDCDGSIDEDFPLLNASCDNGQIGECYVSVKYSCSSDGKGAVCTAPAKTGTNELCDGKDNDCNGSIDIDPKTQKALVQECFTDCGYGNETCIDGTWQNCTAPPEPPEVCDGKDNDCDNVVDEGISCTWPVLKAADQFGASVAIDGDIVVVGAPGDSTNGANTGAAYIYHWNGFHWALKEKKTGAAGGELYGASVAISGNTIAFGAPGVGLIHVFLWNGTALTLQKTLNTLTSATDQFGGSVALNGDVLIGGAHSDDEKGIDSGAAYLFKRVSGTWGPSKKITEPTPLAGAQFGFSVDVSGDAVVIGAPQSGTKGRAYLFSVGLITSGTMTAYELSAENDLTSSSIKAFGSSVAVDGTYALVGTPAYSSNRGGYCHFYGLSLPTGRNPALRGGCYSGTSQTVERFGYAVALNAEDMIVGAPYDLATTPQKGRSAYYYKYPTASYAWGSEEFLPVTGAVGNHFGFSVAISGTRVVIGAPGSAFWGVNSGAVYLFNKISTDCVQYSWTKCWQEAATLPGPPP